MLAYLVLWCLAALHISWQLDLREPQHAVPILLAWVWLWPWLVLARKRWLTRLLSGKAL
jgi:hypothetical protein